MEDYPCPRCEHEPFLDLYDLYDHVLNEHHIDDLTNTLREYMPRKLKQSDFTQVDSHWICVVDDFQLSIAANSGGDFCLHVFGTVEPIPKATQYPTEPEWDRALALANKFVSAYTTALNSD